MFDFHNTGIRELIALQSPKPRTRRVRLSRRFRGRIYWRDNGKCVYCDRDVKFDEMTIDHVQPLVSRGRAKLKENCVTACRGCNKEKGQLQQEILDSDLAPYALAEKFFKVAQRTAERKGHYREWIVKQDNVLAADVI